MRVVERACKDSFWTAHASGFSTVEDAGETVLQPGDSAGWPAVAPDGHHLQNCSQADATFLIVGTRNDEDHGEYSDIDMTFGPGRYTCRKTVGYRHKDGTPY